MHMHTYMGPPKTHIYVCIYICMYIYIVYKWWIFHAMIDKQHPAEKHWKNGPERRAFKSPSTKPRGVERWMMQVGAGENMAPWHTQQQSVTGNLLFLAPCQKKCKEVFNHHCSCAMFLRESRTFSCRNTKLCTCMHHAFFISLSSRI